MYCLNENHLALFKMNPTNTTSLENHITSYLEEIDYDYLQMEEVNQVRLLKTGKYYVVVCGTKTPSGVFCDENVELGPRLMQNVSNVHDYQFIFKHISGKKTCSYNDESTIQVNYDKQTGAFHYLDYYVKLFEFIPTPYTELWNYIIKKENVVNYRAMLHYLEHEIGVVSPKRLYNWLYNNQYPEALFIYLKQGEAQDGAKLLYTNCVHHI